MQKKSDIFSSQVVEEALKSVLPNIATQNLQDPKLELYADLGIDSRGFIRVINKIEKSLKKEINDEDILKIDLITIGDLVTLVESIHIKPL